MEQALELYDEKIGILAEMLRVTVNTKIEGIAENADEEAEDYVALMEKRKGFLDKIILIDKKINAGNYSDNESIKEKKEKIKHIAKELLELDQKQKKIADELMKHIKKNIKEINNGKNLNNLYQNNEYNESALFDQRK